MLNGLRQLSSTLKIALAITFSDLSQTIKDYSFDALLILPLFATNLAQVLNKMHQTNTPRTQHLLPSAANEPNCSGKRILLVEDNPLNMEIACELIGMTGAMIEEATDGAAALTKIAQALKTITILFSWMCKCLNSMGTMQPKQSANYHARM